MNAYFVNMKILDVISKEHMWKELCIKFSHQYQAQSVAVNLIAGNYTPDAGALVVGTEVVHNGQTIYSCGEKR